jgi:carboxymethylenebutenolidase
MPSTRALESVQLAVDDGTTMQAFIACPAAAANAPGIMVYQDAFGVNEHFKDVALRFAAEGFVAIVPELYHRTGTNVQLAYGDVSAARPHTNDLTVEMTEADVRAAFTWLTGAGGVAAGRVASIGYCLGGRVTYLANAGLPLAAAISYYGGGLHAPRFVALAEKQHAPLLMFWAGLDTHIPPENIRVTAEALTAAGKEHTQVVFSHAEHGFFCDDRASFHSNDARESWALTLAFLRSRGLR